MQDQRTQELMLAARGCAIAMVLISYILGEQEQPRIERNSITFILDTDKHELVINFAEEKYEQSPVAPNDGTWTVD